ncbi:hypothetical protein TNCV_967251 [Trichonephila clavipes]|nr:hypothetical protein TNCV_967251 [Trichonephila clavipes]
MIYVSDGTWYLRIRKHITYSWTKMITLVRRLLPVYIDTTVTHFPTSESVDRRTNDIVVMASVGVVAVASNVSGGLIVASCGSDGSIVASCGS